MVVFVTGVHGSGKTYLCENYVKLKKGVIHESASALIKRSKEKNWSIDKRVSDVDANQAALSQEVKNIISKGHKLVLDGHTVLLDRNGDFIPLSCSVFFDLGISAIILVEVSADEIEKRLVSRDATKSTADLDAFIVAEREQAKAIADELGILFVELKNPGVEDFSKVVDKFF